MFVKQIDKRAALELAAKGEECFCDVSDNSGSGEVDGLWDGYPGKHVKWLSVLPSGTGDGG